MHAHTLIYIYTYIYIYIPYMCKKVIWNISGTWPCAVFISVWCDIFAHLMLHLELCFLAWLFDFVRGCDTKKLYAHFFHMNIMFTWMPRSNYLRFWGQELAVLPPTRTMTDPLSSSVKRIYWIKSRLSGRFTVLDDFLVCLCLIHLGPSWTLSEISIMRYSW